MKLLRLNVVLAAIDRDDSSLEALRGACALARSARASLHVVHVTSSGAGTEQWDGADAEVRQLIDRAGLSGADVMLHLLAGDSAHANRSVSETEHADVIVLGLHRGRSGSGHEMGSTALGVVTNSWAPCLILAGPMHLPLERVLVPVDLSETSRGALVVGLSWSSALRGTKKLPLGGDAGEAVALTALHVERSSPSDAGASRQPKALDDELDRLRRDAGTWAHVAIDRAVVGNSDVPQAIANYASEHQPDLIVLGTRGLGLDAVGRLGSVSLGVAQRVTVPVLLVPPAVWHSYARS